MYKLSKLVPAMALLLLGCFAVGATAEGEADAEARKEKILANLTLQFPQLGTLNPVMNEIKASGFEGLDEGSFTVRGRAQTFLVTSDDTKLYLIQGEALDVSKSAEEIQAELDKRAEEEAKQAAERAAELEKATEGVPVRGNADAPVTIVEFSDFQCPYCTRGAATVEEILAKYPNDVKFVFKHFPLGFHPWAKPAAIAANCAGNQNHDAFWVLHDKYFEHQKEITPENVVEKSQGWLADSGVDIPSWLACASDEDTEEYKAEAKSVDEDMAFGQRMGVSGTPGFFVNGQFLNGAQPLSAFEPLIEAAKGEG
ncbi:MAG: thioredoxin domain-containing protein [Acidobacteriota bacterium]